MNSYRLGEVCSIVKGKIGITKAIKGDIPLVVTGEKQKTHNEAHFFEPATIVPLVSSTGHGHASIKRLHYAEGKYAVGSILAVITPFDHTFLNAKYLYIYLTEKKEELLVSQMRGSANVSLTVSRIKDVHIEIPSIKKQNEIIESYEQIQTSEKLLTTELQKRDKLFSHLKQQIFQEAITGRLTKNWRIEQDDQDSIEQLLENIQKEKDDLISKGEIRNQKNMPPIMEDEIPFLLPDGWIWVRLGSICIQTGSGSTPRGGKEVYQDSGNMFIRSQNVYNDGIKSSNIAYISDEINERMKYTKIKEDDLLLNITGGSIGRSAIVTKEYENSNINQHVSIVRLYKKIDINYIHSVFLSQYFQDQIFKNTTGAGRQGLQKHKMDMILIPLPTIREQHEIQNQLGKISKHIYSLNLEQQKQKQLLKSLKPTMMNELLTTS